MALEHAGLQQLVEMSRRLDNGDAEAGREIGAFQHAGKHRVLPAGIGSRAIVAETIRRHVGREFCLVLERCALVLSVAGHGRRLGGPNGRSSSQ